MLARVFQWQSPDRSPQMSFLPKPHPEFSVWVSLETEWKPKGTCDAGQVLKGIRSSQFLIPSSPTPCFITMFFNVSLVLLERILSALMFLQSDYRFRQHLIIQFNSLIGITGVNRFGSWCGWVLVSVCVTSRSGSGECGLTVIAQCIFQGLWGPPITRTVAWVEVGWETFAGIIPLWSRFGFPQLEWKWRIFSVSPGVSPDLMAPGGCFWEPGFVSPLPGGCHHFPTTWFDFLQTDTELLV